MKKKYWELLLIPLIFVLLWLALRWYRQPGVSAGTQAPDFVGITPSGDSLRLSSLQGQWVLIDFWGSWCGPCRQANRQLVPLYRQFKDADFQDAQGFTVLSIGIETDRNKWLSAIAADGLEWPHHVSSLNRFNDPIALLYGIKEIPTSILVSPQGNITGIDLDFNQIRAQLSRNLKK